MNKAQCRIALSAAEQASIVTGRTQNTLGMIKNQCPNSGIVRIDADEKTLSGGSIDDNKVKKMLGDALLDCVNTVRDRDPFGDYEGNLKTYCMICDNIVFTEAFKKKASEKKYGQDSNSEYSIEMLWHWLAVNNIPGNEVTYYERITGNAPEPLEISAMSDTEVVSDSFTKEDFDYDYVTLWQVEKYGKDTAKIAAMTGGTFAIGLALDLIPFANKGVRLAKAVPAYKSLARFIPWQTTVKLAARKAWKGIVVDTAGRAIRKYGTVAVAVNAVFLDETATISYVYIIPKEAVSNTKVKDEGNKEYAFCMQPLNF